MEKVIDLHPAPEMLQALKMKIELMRQRQKLLIDWLWDISHQPKNQIGPNEGWKEIRDAILHNWPQDATVADLAALVEVLIRLAQHFNWELEAAGHEERLWPVSACDAIERVPEELGYHGWSYRAEDDEHAKLTRDLRGAAS